jgi:hypothetical protein
LKEIKMNRILAGVVTAAVLTLVPVSASVAQAQGKHGGGGGGGGANASQMGCTLSGSTMGGPLVLSGSGYTPGASYVVNMLWNNDTSTEGATVVTADPSGNIRLSGYADYAGTYTDNIMSGRSQVATCSTTVP